MRSVGARFLPVSPFSSSQSRGTNRCSSTSDVEPVTSKARQTTTFVLHEQRGQRRGGRSLSGPLSDFQLHDHGQWTGRWGFPRATLTAISFRSAPSVGVPASASSFLHDGPHQRHSGKRSKRISARDPKRTSSSINFNALSKIGISKNLVNFLRARCKERNAQARCMCVVCAFRALGRLR